MSALFSSVSNGRIMAIQAIRFKERGHRVSTDISKELEPMLESIYQMKNKWCRMFIDSFNLIKRKQKLVNF